MTGKVAQYVGIAAITTQAEVRHLQRMLDLLDWPEGVNFMNGPMVSRRTLMGDAPDNPAQYLPTSSIPQLLAVDGRVFNCLHFNSRDPRLCQQLIAIAELSPSVQGIQLNILWPDRRELVRFNQLCPDIKLILQVSRQALSSLGGDLDGVVECLKPYEGLASYGLFDPSGGEGLSYERDQARTLLEKLVESGISMHWGVTGGLCADRVWRLRELLQIYPRLCWDAQSRLRSDEDKLDIESCFGFLAASIALLKAGSS